MNSNSFTSAPQLTHSNINEALNRSKHKNKENKVNIVIKENENIDKKKMMQFFTVVEIDRFFSFI